MRVVRTVAELRAVLAPARRADLRIGLVPTMGALHEGHLSLIRRAREECGEVVVSLFVNPAQFNEAADLDRYPRSAARDAELAAAAGADVLFAPAIEEVYPAGFATQVEVLGLTDRLEGAARGPAHFRGVSTVVTKLLGMAQPDVAYFGAKDAQQALVIRRLVADLDIPCEIQTCATVRERDGLAMSSRNALLSPEQRERARALYAGLSAAAARAAAGERDADALLAAAAAAIEPFEVECEYLALVDPATFEPLPSLDRVALLLVAARVGAVRLIDNLTLECAAPALSPSPAPGASARDHSTRATPSPIFSSPNPDPTGKVATRCSA